MLAQQIVKQARRMKEFKFYLNQFVTLIQLDATK